MTPYDLHNAQGYLATLYSRINERRFEHSLARLGLSRVTWCILLAAGQEGLSAPSGIADYIGIDRTATSRGLRKLEADGLIAREAGAEDKRMTQVSLTATGWHHLARANAAAAANAAHFTDKLEPGELARFTSTLKKLIAGESRDVKGL